jgi:hypothetical protein
VRGISVTTRAVHARIRLSTLASCERLSDERSPNDDETGFDGYELGRSSIFRLRHRARSWVRLSATEVLLGGTRHVPHASTRAHAGLAIHRALECHGRAGGLVARKDGHRAPSASFSAPASWYIGRYPRPVSSFDSVQHRRAREDLMSRPWHDCRVPAAGLSAGRPEPFRPCRAESKCLSPTQERMK